MRATLAWMALSRKTFLVCSLAGVVILAAGIKEATMAASLNTQLGYQRPRLASYGLPGAAQQAAPSSGVTRALAGVTQPPSAPSYVDPYGDVSLGGAATRSLFQTPTYPAVQPTAPANTPSSYTPTPAQAPQAPAGYSFNLETDPILQQIHATAARQRSEADAGALEQRKQLAIQYGDQAYGNSIDQNTGTAAAQNPFSITANLAGQYQTQGKNLNENLNAHNLFYSGARINELAAALKDYQQQQAAAAGQFQQGLGQIDQNRVGALMGADTAEQGGYNDAYSRALAWALAHPTVPTPPTSSQGVDPITGAPLASGAPAAGGNNLPGLFGSTPTVIDFSAGAGAGLGGPGTAPVTPTAVPPELLRLLVR